MTWSDGGIRPSHPEIVPADHDIGGANSANGVLIIGEKGLDIHQHQRQLAAYAETLPERWYEKIRCRNGPSDEPENGHQRKWVDGEKAGFGSKEHKALTSSFDYAGPMTETVLMGNLAIRSYMLRKEDAKGKVNFYGRRKLLWDGNNMKITNFEEANQFVGRTYRQGWNV